MFYFHLKFLFSFFNCYFVLDEGNLNNAASQKKGKKLKN